MKKNKEKKFDAVAEAGRIRREEEIALHGKQIWMRKCRIFESKKSYKRCKFVSLDD